MAVGTLSALSSERRCWTVATRISLFAVMAMTVAAGGAWAASDRASCHVSVIVPRLAGVVATEMQQPAASPAVIDPSRAPHISRNIVATLADGETPSNIGQTLLLQGYSPFQLSAELGTVTRVVNGSHRRAASLEDVKLVVSNASPLPSTSVAPSPASERGAHLASEGMVSLADLANRSVSLDQDAMQALVSVKMPEDTRADPGFTAEVIVTVWQFQ